MPSKCILTAAQKRFIRKNRLKISGSAMARRFGCGEGVVQRWMKQNKLSVSKVRAAKFRAIARIGVTTSTPDIDQFLEDHYLALPEKMISDILDKSHTFVRHRLRQLKLKKPRWLINKFKQESRIKKGNVPMNKGRKMETWMSPEMIERSKAGRFKKGERNHNETFDGAIRIRQGHPERGELAQKFIRISKAKWIPLQIYNWEKVNGPLPKDHILACIDGDPMNTDPSNWYKLSKADNMKRNSGVINLPDKMVAHYLAGKKNKHLKPLLEKQKDLIDLKRQSIILKRKINEQGETNRLAS